MVRRISSGSPFEQRIGYSRAVVDGDMVYVSGTTGYDYATMTMPDDAGAQARNALATIGKALGEAGVAHGGCGAGALLHHRHGTLRCAG